MAIAMRQEKDGLRLPVKVVPGASRDRIMGELGGALKIAVRKPPEAGAANQAVIRLLADALDLPRHSLDILRGHTQPRKEIRVRGITGQALADRLAAIIGQ